jgi:hypothetical protein
MKAQTYYATQSAISDPGDLTPRLADLPDDLHQLQSICSHLIFHYRADGDLAANQIGPERLHEIDSRDARTIFARLFALADQSLTIPRAPHERVVGCCRDFTLLFVALARQQGIPARSRVGFASYFVAGWQLDHVVAEVWDGQEQRWRLLDPELRPGHRNPNDNTVFDPCDLTPDHFIVAPRAWQLCRTGAADPERFVVAPELQIPETRGWLQLKHNLVQDLAAVNKQEMVLWDRWGIDLENQPTAADRALLDHTAATMLAAATDPAILADLYQQPAFQVPTTVLSFSPAEGTPRQIDLTNATAGY